MKTNFSQLFSRHLHNRLAKRHHLNYELGKKMKQAVTGSQESGSEHDMVLNRSCTLAICILCRHSQRSSSQLAALSSVHMAQEANMKSGRQMGYAAKDQYHSGGGGWEDGL